MVTRIPSRRETAVTARIICILVSTPTVRRVATTREEAMAVDAIITAGEEAVGVEIATPQHIVSDPLPVPEAHRLRRVLPAVPAVRRPETKKTLMKKFV